MARTYKYTIMHIIIYTLLLLLLLIPIYNIIRGYKQNTSVELFQDALAQLKSEQSQISKLNPDENLECNSAKFINICKNYDTCCKNTGGGTDNCICKHINLQKCQTDYNNCLNSPEWFSKESIDYIGADARAAYCSKILNNCCTLSDKKYNHILNTAGDIMQVVEHVKPGGDKPPLCQMLGNTKCKESCAADSRCKVAYLDNLLGMCELYDSEVIRDLSDSEKLGGTNFNVWTKKTTNITHQPVRIIDHFAADTNTAINTKNAPLIKSCLTGTYIDGCQPHPIISNCNTQYTKCVSDYSKLYNKRDATELCNKNKNACCIMLNNVDIANRFSMDNGGSGTINNNNIICDASNAAKNLEDCKYKCMENPNCLAIDSNLGIFKHMALGGLKNMPPAYCKLYNSSIVKNINKKASTGIGGITGHNIANIYKKIIHDDIDVMTEEA